MDRSGRIVGSNQSAMWRMLGTAGAAALALFLTLTLGRDDHVEFVAAGEVTPSQSLDPESGAPGTVVQASGAASQP